ncbi:MAG: MATE family efflux transporter [Zoogloeaceae bacterium]|nr:MATE family efflux transporter [Zoogloeaceae bacterium]
MSAFSRLSGRIFNLAWPVLIAQMISVGMMAADTLIVGHFSTRHLAAVAVASGLYITVALALGGVLQALAPIIGQHWGAGETRRIGADLRQGLWLAGFLALGGLLLLHGFAREMIAPARLDPDIERIAEDYLRLLAFALPATLGYRAFHAAATALGQPRPLMIIACVETAAHALLAWLLVGGHLFFPPLGALGAAGSQVLVTLISLAISFWLLLKHPHFAPYDIFSAWEKPDWRAQKELLRLGVPMGFSYLVEISAFTLMAIFIARLGSDVVSGHRIAANLAAFVYMLPLSLAIATATLVAQAVGAGREDQARASARAGVALASFCAVAVAALLLCLTLPIVRLATGDPQVAGIAAGLIFYITLYQFFDAIQTAACFALRAYKVSFLPLLIHLLCFWGLGLGLGYWLAFFAATPQGAAGFWQASVAATIVAALLLGGLLLWVMRTRHEDKPARAREQ